MRSVEAVIVFGDINKNPLRYPISFFKLLTPMVFLLSIYGLFRILKKQVNEIKNKKIGPDLEIHSTLIFTVFIYIVFYSLTPRLIERWMVPIIPILIIYASKAFVDIYEEYNNRKMLIYFISILTLFSTMFFTFSLVRQLNAGKPRVNAYIWFSNYLNENNRREKSVLMYTNKGYRDPFSRLDNCDLNSFNVYESRGAQNVYPKDPLQYDYVILYSTMEKNYENNYVKSKYPKYYEAWSNFTKTVKKPENFKLIGEFKTTKPDLIVIPNISIYENLKVSDDTK